MKSLLMAGLLALVSVPCVAAQPVVRDFRTTVQLNVDTRGQVVKVGQPVDLPTILVPAVRKAAAQWRFKAAKVGGVAVTATTWADVDVQLVKRANEQYGVHVVYENNGPKIIRRYKPAYPQQAKKQYEQGSVLVQANVEPDGSFADVHVVKRQGSTGVGFDREARAAIRRWKALPMRLNGKPVVTPVQVAVHFTLETCGWGERCPPLTAKKPGATKADPAWIHEPAGQFVATDSPLQRLPAMTHKQTGA